MNAISVKTKFLRSQIEYMFYTGRRKEAYSLIDELSGKSKAEGNYQFQNSLNITLGSFYLQENRYFESEAILRETYANCIRFLDVTGLIQTSNYLSEILSYNGLHYEAIEIVREAIDKAQIEYLNLIPICYFQLARIHWELGELENANKYCDVAITQKNNIKLDDFEEKIVTWKLYNLKGLITHALGDDFYQILYYYSLAKYHALNHHIIEAIPEIYLNIAVTFLQIGKFESARYYLENCILVSEEIDNFKVLSTAYETIAEIYGLKGNYVNAHNYFEKAIALRLSLKLSMWSIYNKLAILERSYGLFKEAIENHEAAIEFIELYQEYRQKALILAQYSITLLRMNKKELAIEFIKKAKEILESQKRTFIPEIFVAEGLYFLIADGPEVALECFFKAYSISQEKSQPVNVVESSLYVIKCLLSMYNENYQVRNFLMAQKYIEEAYKIAIESNIYPHIIIIELLQGGLKAAEYNYGEALKTIVKGVNKANELGFKKESEDGRNFIQQINLALSRVGNLASMIDSSTSILSPSVFQTDAVLNYVDKLINIKDNKADPFDFILITFKFSEKGPEPFFMSPGIEEFKKMKNSVSFILNLGVMLTYLLGQGHEYFEGLYSIPIQGFKTLSLALVYSAKVSDSQSVDERMKGKNFIIFCFIFPDRFEKDVSRIGIKDIFNNFIIKNKDVANWERKDLEALRLSIIDIVLKS